MLTVSSDSSRIIPVDVGLSSVYMGTRETERCDVVVL